MSINLNKLKSTGGLDVSKNTVQTNNGLIPTIPTVTANKPAVSPVKPQSIDIAKTPEQVSKGFIQPQQNQQSAKSPVSQTLIPTKANPVIVQEAKPTQVGGVDYSQVDNMDTNSLQRYVDEWQVKATMGEEIPTSERMKLLAASRKLATLTSPTTVANPYEAQIKTQEQQRAEREAQLKAQEQTMMSAEERRLNAVYAERARQAQEAGQRTATAGQQAMSFSGLGRSTFNADQQARIQQGVENNIAALEQEKFIANERYRAEQAGATADQLSGYDQRISQLRDKQAQFQLQQADQINKYNQESAASYQDKINNLLSYAQSWKDPNAQLTEEDIAQAKAYGQLLIDKDGKINEKFAEQIPPALYGKAMEFAAEARGAIPQDKFDFMNLGSGLVAKTNKATGEVEWYQGDVKLTPLEVAKINEINAGILNTNADTAKTMSGLQPSGETPTNATKLISKWEGFRDKAYQDSAGVWTVGFGFTNLNGRPVQPGDTIDRASAEQLLQKEIGDRQNFMKYITVPLNESQKAALASFEYNLGSGIWDKNAKPILDKVNQGDLAGAANLMKQYINADGKPIPGLVNRRNEEAQLLQSTVQDKAPLTKEEKSTLFSIQDDLKADPRRKEYLTLNSKIKTLEGIKTRLNTGKATAQDKQQLISDFAKVLDPTSVVRTEEYALAAKYGQSAINKTIQEISNWYDTNGPLSDTSAKVLAEAVGLRYESAKLSNDEAVEEQKKRAEIFLGRPVSYDELAVTKSQAPAQTPQQSNIPAALANPNQPQGEQPTQAELDLINSL